MMSVTQRIKSITQPRNGYLNLNTFKIEKYLSSTKLNETPIHYRSLQGLVVDYMVRYLTGSPKSDAFRISLLGAKLVSEIDKAKELLNEIKGLNGDSLLYAYKLVGYDVAYRRGKQFYTDNKTINPDEVVLNNAIALIKQTLDFFENNDPIIKTGFTFEGAYNEIISSGDGDYLSNDTLWDLKVSPNEPNKDDTLQVLVYYILGRYSIHQDFQDIRNIGIFNPILNKSYTLELSQIPDEVFSQVTHQVLGYKVPNDSKKWANATTIDPNILNSAKSGFTIFIQTNFDPKDFDDGIHDISIEDYWTYYGNTFNRIRKPKLPYTKQIKFLKSGNYYMFISINHNGNICSLNGGQIRKLNHKVEYYYSNLIQYGDTVLTTFSEYWSSLKQVSSLLKRNIPDNNNQLGNVHGSIVDIDYFNHVYLNPFDGTLTPYFATSTRHKVVYRNVISLLSARRPELVKRYKRSISRSNKQSTIKKLLGPFKDKFEIVKDGSNYSLEPIYDQSIDSAETIVSDMDIYKVSNKMVELQKIYDHGLVTIWYEDYISEDGLLERNNRLLN